jgi:hypothetical protein
VAGRSLLLVAAVVARPLLVLLQCGMTGLVFIIFRFFLFHIENMQRVLKTKSFIGCFVL